MEKFEIIVKTFQGLESLLSQELLFIGASNVQIQRRAVSCEGNLETLYKANLYCRTAVRVLKPVFSFTATNPEEVYNELKKINWDDYFSLNDTFSVESTIYSDNFKHSKFVSYKVKDAIVDFFNEKYSKRPSVSITNPDIQLNLHISQDRCTLSLDSSGESLHKRGYRVAQTDAPINEVLAAGMLLTAGWNGQCDFYDPMCGSGTILIEAAMIALNIPPGIYRNKFGFEKWKDYDAELFEKLYNDESNERTFDFKIYGSDISNKAISIALQNIKRAGVSKYISLETKPLQQVEAPSKKGLMVTNPPYGERIGAKREILSLYETLGERLKHHFTGWDAWVISSNFDCFAKIGLKPSEKIPLINSTLECEFRHYEIFEGKHKDFKKQSFFSTEKKEFKTYKKDDAFREKKKRPFEDTGKKAYPEREKNYKSAKKKSW